jgi:hypothetical protein
MKRSTFIQIVAAISGPALLVGAVFFATNNFLAKPVRASAYTATFNHNNAPTLDEHGDATITDHRGIIWEYHNATSYADGHISLNHEGYFGISQSSPYGLKGIEAITPDFVTDGNAELWLLRSPAGAEDWGEDKVLESQEVAHGADGWQYVRFYNYASDGSSIDINSIIINYSCETISGSDDTDQAIVDNVIKKSNTVSLSMEYGETSPRGDSVQALKITNTNGTSSGNREVYIDLGDSYSGEYCLLRSEKIEFDYYHSKRGGDSANPSYPLVTLANGKTKLPNQIEQGANTAKHNAYTATPINSDWWHIECYISSILAPNLHTDVHEAISSLVINDPKIYDYDDQVAYAIIDNVRVRTLEPQATLSNNTSSFKLGGDDFMMRENYCGALYGRVAVSSDETKATVRVEPDFTYVHAVAKGKVEISITYTLGYSRAVFVLKKTLTITQ